MPDIQPGADGTGQTVDKPAGGQGAAPGGQASGTTENPSTPAVDEDKWDESTRNYIKSLRDESAKHRTKSKELQTQFTKLSGEVDALKGGLRKALGGKEDDQSSPEEQVGQLTSQNEQMAFRLAVMDSALENGITSKEQLEYYEFLVQKKATELQDDEEITDEAMTEIIQKVKSFSKPGGTSTTSVGAKKPEPSDSSSQAVSVEAFAKMSLAEKSALYSKDPAQYTQLMSAARQKKLI